MPVIARCNEERWSPGACGALLSSASPYPEEGNDGGWGCSTGQGGGLAHTVQLLE